MISYIYYLLMSSSFKNNKIMLIPHKAFVQFVANINYYISFNVITKFAKNVCTNTPKDLLNEIFF